ncbi:MAG: acyl CoA:acetate/3-ketoacid CoA transferase [Pseudomonadota bacterium]|nr:acyl CoA:acetate/3-ketoacid CoA transferase [Pseudomonadota bacterium]
MARNVERLQPAEIAARIFDSATIALTGSGIFLEADEIFAALESSFLTTGRPRDLTIVHALGIGDGRGSGLSRFAYAGMVRRVIGGHWSWSPRMQQLAQTNAIEAYAFPAGAISNLLREIGAKRPGLITRIGLGTFADPRLDGGRCNAAARDELVELIEIAGQPYLRYKPMRIDFAFIRATESDSHGNLTSHREPADLDSHAVALAAHNCGGRVFAQVESMRDRRTLHARLVRVPGVLVDGVLIAPHSRKTYLPNYEPRISGEAPLGAKDAASASELPTGIRRIIAQRALAELRDARSVNFGFGIPGGIPALAAATREVDYWGTVEQGIHNGEMLDGPMFGSARDPDAIISSNDQFDFYSGGGIDVAFLGMGEMDQAGNVNVSKIGGRLVGPGGFVDITQTARKVVFCGAFEAKGLSVEQDAAGALRILAPGELPKLVAKVEHVTFSGAQARANGQEVLYITERAVFRLDPDGVALVEAAPGLDLQRDILARMEFAPLIRLSPAGESYRR